MIGEDVKQQLGIEIGELDELPSLAHSVNRLRARDGRASSWCQSSSTAETSGSTEDREVEKVFCCSSRDRALHGLVPGVESQVDCFGSEILEEQGFDRRSTWRPQDKAGDATHGRLASEPNLARTIRADALKDRIIVCLGVNAGVATRCGWDADALHAFLRWKIKNAIRIAAAAAATCCMVVSPLQ